MSLNKYIILLKYLLTQIILKIWKNSIPRHILYFTLQIVLTNFIPNGIFSNLKKNIKKLSIFLMYRTP